MPQLAFQATYLLTGDGIAKLAYLALFLLIARHLGAESLGAFTFVYISAITLGTVFDLGLARFGTRELARIPKGGSAGRLLGRLLILKGTGALITAGTTAALPALLSLPPETRALAYPLALFAAANSLTELTYGGLRAAGSFRREAGIKISARVGAITLAGASLALGNGVGAVAWAIALGSGIEFLLGLVFLIRQGVNPILACSFKELGGTLRQSAGLALLPLFTVLYVSGDQLLLAALRPLEEAGLYSAAYRLLDAFVLLPAAVAGVLLPRLSASERAQAYALTHRVLTFLLPPAVLAALTISLGSRPLAVMALGPEMQASAYALPWLAWAGVAICVHYVLGTSMIAGNEEGALTRTVGLAAVVNLVANAFMIPVWGFTGAAAATLLTEVFIAAMLVARRLRGRNEALPHQPSAELYAALGGRLKRLGRGKAGTLVRG